MKELVMVEGTQPRGGHASRAVSVVMRGAALFVAIALFNGSPVSAADASRPEERRATLHVKEAAAPDVIRSLQKQCGVKNVVIDGNVAGHAAFYLTNVPCTQAWSVVLQTYGLAATSYSENVLHVETRR